MFPARKGFLFNPSKALVRLAVVVPLVVVVAGILAACNGDGSAAGTDSADSEAPAVQFADFVHPLFDDDGNPLANDPRARQPSHPAEWVANGRYATPAQARFVMELMGSDAIEISVGCCGSEAVDFAVISAWVSQVASNLPHTTPVLVRGADLRLAAAAANRIASGGLANVWLVTQ